MLFRAIPEVLPQAHTSDLSVLDLRKSLVSTFTEVLGGDGLAAEYTLLHLLSHVIVHICYSLLNNCKSNFFITT